MCFYSFLNHYKSWFDWLIDCFVFFGRGKTELETDNNGPKALCGFSTIDTLKATSYCKVTHTVLQVASTGLGLMSCCWRWEPELQGRTRSGAILKCTLLGFNQPNLKPIWCTVTRLIMAWYAICHVLTWLIIKRCSLLRQQCRIRFSTCHFFFFTCVQRRMRPEMYHHKELANCYPL